MTSEKFPPGLLAYGIDIAQWVDSNSTLAHPRLDPQNL